MVVQVGGVIHETTQPNINSVHNTMHNSLPHRLLGEDQAGSNREPYEGNMKNRSGYSWKSLPCFCWVLLDILGEMSSAVSIIH